MKSVKIRKTSVKYILIILLMFTYRLSYAGAATGDDIHEKANWLGELIKDEKTKKLQIRIFQELGSAELPESSKWVELKSPLNIKLFKKNAMKEVKAVRYQYEPGCEAYPFYELQTKEDLNPKEWRFAAPENKQVHWVEDHMRFRKTNDEPFKISDIPSYEWDRLYDKLSFAVMNENSQEANLTHLKKDELIAQIKKQAIPKVSGLRTDTFITVIFGDLEFKYEGKDKRGQKVKKLFSIHRAYRPSNTGGLDEIPPPNWSGYHSAGYFWSESYAPNQPIYLNTVNGSSLILRMGDYFPRSLYFLTDFRGGINAHNFVIGATSCD